MIEHGEKFRCLVDLGDVKMSRDAKQQLEKALQQTAMDFLARYTDEKEVAIKFNDLINGIVIRRSFPEMQEALKEIEHHHEFLAGK